LARRHAAGRALPRVPGPAAERQAARPPGLLPLWPGPRCADPRVGAGHRRVRALCRGPATLDGAARPHPVAAHLTRYHLAMDRPAPRRVELIRHTGTARHGIVRRIDVEISWTPEGALQLRYF